MLDHLRRYEAAEATKTAFHNRVFEWGTADCLALAAHCLRGLGHPKPTKGVLRYRTERGAIRAMLKSGFRSLVEAVDAYGLTRIPPAMAVAGDIIALPTDDSSALGPYALAVALGEDKVLAFVPRPEGAVGEIGPLSVAAQAAHTAGQPILAWRAV